METDKFKKQFGNEAKNYSKYRRPYPDELYVLLFSLMPKEQGKVLDVGCGTGKSTEPLVNSGLEIHGCDHDSLMIEEAKEQAQKKNLRIEYVVADTERLPFPDGYFDVVTIGTALHFFVNEAAVQELKRVLKPKGLLFVYWTLTTKEIPEEDEIPGSIYRKYNWIKIPSELRDLKYISEFFDKGGLQKISTKRMPITYTTTVEERVGLQTTSGTFELLSEEDKKLFLEEVRHVLMQKLGDRPHFTLHEEIQVCWGFKSM
jgi:ubiquinone/menaquinone biosynthesis C-methylase UbiE